jgi:hypothetical protein
MCNECTGLSLGKALKRHELLEKTLLKEKNVSFSPFYVSDFTEYQESP